MRAASRSVAAYSLIELMVVVAIIVVLASILLPCVRMVRDLAQTAQCASNLRQTGTFVLQYVEDNHGRFPGAGHTGAGSVSWCDIINLELLADEKVKLPRMTDPPGTNLLCPAYNPPPSSWRRCYTFNGYASGGGITIDPDTSDYGQVFDPPAKRNPAYASWVFYCLGAPLARFSAPSDKVLMQDNERASDGAGAGWPEGVLNQGDDPAYPPYAARGGTFAFRHRGGKVMNFLMMDLRIEGRNPSGELNRSARYAF